MNAKELVTRYNSGLLPKEEYSLLEQYIERGEVDIEELEGLRTLASANILEHPEPSPEMSQKFYRQLAEAKQRMTRKPANSWLAGLWFDRPALRWAYTVTLLLIGLCAGLLLRMDEKGQQNKQIEKLSTQVSEMKEMMMLTLLERESPSDRLKAVNLTSEMTEVSGKVTDALLQTLNNDPNVNVRLAALEALYPYAGEALVREGLIRSIAHQKSPIVQVALAEMMVALQEKRSVEGLEQIVEDRNTPPEVRDRIEKSIEVLI